MIEPSNNKDIDKSQPRRFFLSWSKAVAKEADFDQNTNENIEDLKIIANKKYKFKRTYYVLNRIAIENDFEAMRFAVKEKFCDAKGKYDVTIFQRSVKKHNIQLVRLLIEFGGNNNYNNEIFNDSDFLRYILKQPRFDINDALIWASIEGHYEVIKHLLTVPGIDINAKDKYNRTGLNYASSYGYHEVVKLLLTVPGIDFNAKDVYFRTALIWASSNGHHEVVKLLLAVPGIDVNARDEDNSTALIHVSECGYHEVVKLLIAAPGIDVNAKDEDNWTALFYASCEGHFEIVKLLLTVPGIDVNSRDENNWTALFYASQQRNDEIVELLLAFPGIDI